MRARVLVPLLTLYLAACGSLPGTPATPYLPAGVFGTYEDNDIGAINQSAWAFASPANTRGNPLAAIKAILGLEYLSGELRENPRWVSMDLAVKQHMSSARDQIREILGIPQNVPPQLVVNAMLRLSEDLFEGDRLDIDKVLSTPVFTLAPERTLYLLYNIPYVREANLATSRAAQQSFPRGGLAG